MNIGIFTDTYYPEINGVANSTYELKKGLEMLGHTVYIFTVSNPASPIKDEAGVYRIASVPFPALKERRIGCTLPKAWKRKIRKFHLDIIHTQTEFMVGHLGRKLADWLKIPHIHTYHTVYEDYLSYLHMPDRRCFRRVVRRFSRLCCNRADDIIVPTEKVRELLRQYGVSKEVHVIPSGISLDKFTVPEEKRVLELRSQVGIPKDRLVLLYVGRLSTEKNISELLGLIHKMENRGKLMLLLVGDGPERSALECQVKELGLETCVIFAGMVPFDKIENYYALGDIFVSASTSETQGLTYIEALATGMPLLVRRDAALNGVLLEYENGVSYEDEKMFQDGLHYLATYQGEHMRRKTIRESVSRLGTARFARQVELLYLASMAGMPGNRNIQDVIQYEKNNGTIYPV